MTDTYKPLRFRIWSLTTRNTILHVEDALAIEKLHFDLWRYRRGAGSDVHVSAYLDVDDARVLAHDLATGRLSTLAAARNSDGDPERGFEARGGSANGGQDGPIARLLRVQEAEDTRNPIRITVVQGPGEVLSSGLITFKRGETPERLSVLLSRYDARSLGLAVLSHISAHATATYFARVREQTWQPAPTADDMGRR